MAQPIGRRVLQACEIVRKIGPSTTRQVAAHMPDLQIDCVHKYCSRAVGLGLLTVDRSVFPKQYTVVDKIVDREPKERPRPVIRHEPHALHGIWR